MLDYLPAGEGRGPKGNGPSRSGEMPPQKSDRDLVEAARGGDSEAFGAFVRRHQRRVFRLAVHLLHNSAEAEDVTQEAFVRAYGALDRFDGRSEPFTWLYRIAVNLSLNAIRSRKTRRPGAAMDDPRIEAALIERRPGLADPARHATDRELALALCDGIDALSETLRTTLVLVAVDGLSHAEVSQVLGCPEGTVAWRVHEARRKLKEFLNGRGHASDDESET
ncbi:MAG TPA: sigma-70 family RNA polymerase sigma factor [Polyangiaceae bacterium]|nr:sigma-70 family RNA polymerase sigma factor [Polyangiaceae bacterium]